MTRRKDITGQRFGKLVALSPLPFENRNTYWLCRCDCGQEAKVSAANLRRGATKSCGCLRREKAVPKSWARLTAHGQSRTRLYKIWTGMKSRCSNPNKEDYKNYGGRGIRVCAEWISDFVAFREWALANGYRDDLTLDRLDVNGDYRPDNCQWITVAGQNNNTRRNHFLTYKGETRTIAEWARIKGLRYNTLMGRINSGEWTVEQALETPAAPRK